MKKTILGITLIMQATFAVASDNLIDFNDYYQDYSSKQVLCNEALIYGNDGDVSTIISDLCSYQPILSISDHQGGVKIKTNDLYLVPLASSVMRDSVNAKNIDIPEEMEISNEFILSSGDAVILVGSSNYRGYILSYLGDDIGYDHVFKIIKTNKFSENQHKIIKAKKRR